MTYKVSVFTSEVEDVFHPWFTNFRNTFHKPIPTADRFREYTEALAEHSAEDIAGTSLISFKTEQDFLLFVLKFG